MPFSRRLVRVEQLDERLWRLIDGVAYKDKGEVFEVPAGFVTDFASVPAIMGWLIQRSGKHNPAAIVHDYLLVDRLPRGELSSRRIDEVFRHALRDLGVGVGRRWLMWAGVRLGALTNPLRRPGSLGTLPGVLSVLLLALPLLLPATVAVAATLLLVSPLL